MYNTTYRYSTSIEAGLNLSNHKQAEVLCDIIEKSDLFYFNYPEYLRNLKPRYIDSSASDNFSMTSLYSPINTCQFSSKRRSFINYYKDRILYIPFLSDIASKVAIYSNISVQFKISPDLIQSEMQPRYVDFYDKFLNKYIFNHNSKGFLLDSHNKVRTISLIFRLAFESYSNKNNQIKRPTPKVKVERIDEPNLPPWILDMLNARTESDESSI